MSFDIHVLVPADAWPSARELDASLVKAGYPIRLGERAEAAWDAPLAPVAGVPFKVRIDDPAHAQILGQPVGTEIEMSHDISMPVVLNGVELDPDFGMEVVEAADDINAMLLQFDNGPTASSGDHLIWFSHHVDQRHYNAGMYVLAALILYHHGHGFESQGMSHGREAFAKELLDSMYENPIENPYD